MNTAKIPKNWDDLVNHWTVAMEFFQLWRYFRKAAIPRIFHFHLFWFYIRIELWLCHNRLVGSNKLLLKITFIYSTEQYSSNKILLQDNAFNIKTRISQHFSIIGEVEFLTMPFYFKSVSRIWKKVRFNGLLKRNEKSFVFQL